MTVLEELRLVAGDVFTSRPWSDDAAERASTIRRKPRELQAALWRPIHDSAFAPTRWTSEGRPWTGPWQGPEWTEKGGVYDQLAKRMLDEGPDDAVAVETIEQLRGKTERFMNILSTIVTASPMLGILGTVTGIIQSFELLGGQRALVDPRDVSSGIGEALITTAAGLVIALAALFPYMLFRGYAERALGRFESIVTSAKQGLGPVRNWSVKR